MLEDAEAEFHWLQLADFYPMAPYNLFWWLLGSWKKVDNLDADFGQIHHLMAEEVERKKN